MEVLNGYKQTSIGIFPEDWEVKKLGNFAELKGRIGYRGYTIDDIVPREEGVISISPSNISSHKLDLSSSTYISWFKYEESPEIKLSINEILLVKTGSTYGKTCFVENLSEPCTINPQLVIIKNIKENPKFISYVVAFSYFQKQINQVVVGGAIPTLSQEEVLKFKIPLPPLPEQQKIAEILSTWDKAIELCQKTIEELRSRNKGLAQQLLSGKINNKNEEDQLKDYHIIGKYVKEVSKRNTALQEKRILSVTNSRGFINQSEQFGRELASADLSNYKIVKKGQFAYNPSRVNVGSLDMLRTFDAGVLSPMYVVFEVTSKDLIPEFLYYHLKTYWFIGHIPMFVQGSVRDTLSFDGFSGMKFYIPTLEEQKKIVTILDAAASELKHYEEKLQNLKLQKKGLMQQLLTGKVRVKI